MEEETEGGIERRRGETRERGERYKGKTAEASKERVTDRQKRRDLCRVGRNDSLRKRREELRG